MATIKNKTKNLTNGKKMDFINSNTDFFNIHFSFLDADDNNPGSDFI